MAQDAGKRDQQRIGIESRRTNIDQQRADQAKALIDAQAGSMTAATQMNQDMMPMQKDLLLAQILGAKSGAASNIANTLMFPGAQGVMQTMLPEIDFSQVNLGQENEAQAALLEALQNIK